MSEGSNSYVLIDQEMYQVEAIKDKRIYQGKLQYLVKWLHWDKPQDLTWEPVENLNNVEDLIKEFQHKSNRKQKKQDYNQPTPHRQTMEKKQKLKLKKQQKQSQLQKIKHSHHHQKSASPSNTSPKPPKKPSLSKNHHKSTQKHSQKHKQHCQKQPSIKKQANQIQISDSEHDLRVSMSGEQEDGKISSRNQVGSSQSNSNDRSGHEVGWINHIFVKYNGESSEVFYEVDIVNKSGNCIGVRLMSEREVKMHHQDKLLRFLQNHLLQEQKIKKMMI